MMTNDVTPTRARLDAPRRIARGTRAASVGAFGLAISLVLTGCGGQPEGTYIEGYWDNGDPFYAPSKTALFDENGVPTCAFPVKYNLFESRATGIGLAKGVAFEVMNPESDPNGFLDPADFPTTEEQATERLRRERALNSLDVLWEYTHPQFDADNGIETPEDLAPMKAELQEHLYGLGKDAPFLDFLELKEVYFMSDVGEFIVERLGNPGKYLTDNGIPIEFDGFNNEYYSATTGGVEYLLVKEKETGDTSLWQGDQQSEVGDAIWYARIEVKSSLSALHETPVMAEFLVQSDGCPDKDDRAYQRYYLRSYELLYPEPGDEEGEPAPEPSPSA
jgi:hypothetical protein